MNWVRSYTTSLFSYLFATSAFSGVVCAFFLIVFGLKNTFAETNEVEREIAHYLFILFAVNLVTVPITFLLSNRLEQFRRKKR